MLHDSCLKYVGRESLIINLQSFQCADGSAGCFLPIIHKWFSLTVSVVTKMVLTEWGMGVTDGRLPASTIWGMRVMMVILLALLVGCTAVPDLATNSPVAADTAVSQPPTPTLIPASPLPPTTTPEFRLNRRVEMDETYALSGLLPFDGILPVYQPQFAAAADAPLKDDELVLGVAWDGEAKAYPISVLRFREMVNDELAGIPTLVTW